MKKAIKGWLFSLLSDDKQKGTSPDHQLHHSPGMNERNDESN